MNVKKNFPFYILLILSFLGFKLTYSLSSVDDLKFVLLPVSFLVEVFTGARFQFLSGEGYFFQRLNCVIDKSCSGVNYLLITFLMISFLALKHLKGPWYKLLSMFLALLVSYLYTILVNSIRIFSSFYLGRFEMDLFKGSMAHEAIGVLTNISFLILIYIGIDKLFTKYLTHAELN